MFASKIVDWLLCKGQQKFVAQQPFKWWGVIAINCRHIPPPPRVSLPLPPVVINALQHLVVSLSQKVGVLLAGVLPPLQRNGALQSAEGMHLLDLPALLQGPAPRRLGVHGADAHGGALVPDQVH